MGDLVIDINPEDTNAYEARIVIEAKRRKLSLRAIDDELERAIENREATVAIAVFDSQANSPFKVPFHYSGDFAYVVHDPAGDDDSALRLAYMWARWVARRQVNAAASEEAGLDLAALQSLVEEATTALSRISNIKRNHSKARKAIEDAAQDAEGLVADVRSTLSELLDALSAAE